VHDCGEKQAQITVHGIRIFFDRGPIDDPKLSLARDDR
jgi:hypothetical protein